MKSSWILCSYQLSFSHKKQGIRTFNHTQRIRNRLLNGWSGTCDEMRNNFRITVCLINRTLPFQLISQAFGINQTSIVRHCDLSTGVTKHQRLSVQQTGVTGCGVAHMPNSDVPCKLEMLILPKCFSHQSCTAMRVKFFSIGNTYPRAFLTTVLQRMQSEIGQLCCLSMIKNTEDAAHEKVCLRC